MFETLVFDRLCESLRVRIVIWILRRTLHAVDNRRRRIAGLTSNFRNAVDRLAAARRRIGGCLRPDRAQAISLSENPSIAVSTTNRRMVVRAWSIWALSILALLVRPQVPPRRSVAFGSRSRRLRSRRRRRHATSLVVQRSGVDPLFDQGHLRAGERRSLERHLRSARRGRLRHLLKDQAL